MALLQKLDEKSLKVFNDASQLPFSGQAQFFLNAFWAEHGENAPFIYSICWDLMIKQDMASRKFNYIHEYFDTKERDDGLKGGEGLDVDFDIALAYFEALDRIWEGKTQDKDFLDFFRQEKGWQAKHSVLKPEMQTAIIRKKELKNKVDVNFNGRMSMLEFLCYQLKASPKDLVSRMETSGKEDPEVTAAKAALADVNKQVAAYEAEKQRLTDLSEKSSGVKKLRYANELEQMLKGPLWEGLNKALITAEAKVRLAVKSAKKRAGEGGAGSTTTSTRNQGTLWWMQYELALRKRKYGKRK